MQQSPERWEDQLAEIHRHYATKAELSGLEARMARWLVVVFLAAVGALTGIVAVLRG